MHLNYRSFSNQSLLLFFSLLFLNTAIGLSQGKEIEKEKEKDTSNIAPMIYFGWAQRTTPKSLEPYYKELKTAEYGVQRFSIIDQLLDFHIRKTNTDSVVHYANLYLKEVNNWSQTPKIKERFSSKANYYLGKGNIMNGLYDNAVKWFLQGLQEAEETNYTEFKYKHKLGLAQSYISQGNIDKAIGLLEKSLSEFTPEFPSLKTQNYILLGKAYRFNNDYIQAQNYYDKASKVSNTLDDEETLLTIRLEIAKLKEAQNDFKGAFPEYETTRNEAKEKGFDAIYFEGSLLIARLFYKQGFYDIAVLGLSTAYINAIDSDNLQFQRESLIIQSRCFQEQNDYENAYASMTQLFRVIGEINERQQKAIIKELEVQYETLEKEKEINTLEEDKLLKEAELSRQKTIKNAFLIGFLVILIPIIALLFVYYQKLQTQSELSKKQEEINTQKVKSLIQEQELNLIKAAVEGQDEERKRIAQELHDSIGGNLAGIKLQLSSLAKDSDALKTINTQIDETYQLVRDISHTLIPKKFKQNAFTDLVQEFANSISRTNTIQVAFHPHPKENINKIDEKIQVELFKILQELMTNTQKHAKAKNVDIHLNLIGDELSLLFEDNGKGFNTLEKETGIGLKNITSRIKKLKGTLHIDSSENRGTVIAIEIPDLKKTVHEL
ncbi:integral membrane sensor signal transduction histidine kinase [Cellulophaga algicola DSM 14237]|uniref:histidine kinase n=1 Tax=Cellulophaga algicola (strain DSM 14237 / IC166 / ACAM 630) TaxID=688270 RepID=E6X5Y3_CELAD|nr:sensor histidine kinase [Cellulophaga algicola]ADV49525.1 integral membrane sensor signal transduction histidine kinase [Cellulophaga algicola DSM 14237]